MDTIPDPEDRSKQDAARLQCLAQDAEMLKKAQADVASGRIVSLEDVEAWVESWDTDRETAPPSFFNRDSLGKAF